MADTAIVVLLGQSLNTWRGATRELQTGDASARQLVGGGTTQEMDFYATSVQNGFDWNDGATLATQSETVGGQSPLAGIATKLAAVGYTRTYVGSTAIGGQAIDILRGSGPMCNVYGMLQRLIALAAAAGDTAPEVFFYMAHGEQDGIDANANYATDLTSHLQRCQFAAAQAMGDPTYVAPVILSYPLQNQNPTVSVDASDDINIKEAIKSVADSGDVANTILYGSIYHWEDEATHIHPEETAYVLRGEAIGKVIADYIGGTTYQPLRITSVALSGSEVTVNYTHDIINDTSTIGDVSSLLDGTDGFEYIDNGSDIVINSVAYSGNTATLTLASTPTGTDAQQVLRCGVPVAVGAGAWPTYTPGQPIRKDMTAWTSTFDVTYDNYDWALQEEISGLPYSYTPPAAVVSSGGTGGVSLAVASRAGLALGLPIKL